MTSITTELAAILSSVDRPGDFFVSGTIEFHAPRLEVEGVGIIAMPLLPVQARQLIAAAERAPFGRGEETLVDTDVRRTWQINSDRVRIGGKHWGQTLEDIRSGAAEGLGVTGPTVAEFYKLLVYDEGSFFISHRDTEKAAGMFATLVLVLPSKASGGELLIRHKDREVRLDLCCEEPSELAFAAFYADCIHEVLPVTAGCRLALVYNLSRKGKGAAPEPPAYESEQVRVTALLQSWVEDQQSPAPGSETSKLEPTKLVYLLDHAYTPAELAFNTLKGADAAVAGVLAAAAPKAGCDLHLALLTIEESGAAEYTNFGGSYRGRWSEPEFEAGEVFDRHESLSEWRRPDGGTAALGELPINEDELSPPDIFDDLEPDEEEFREATGNEGASFERTYRRAALVLWPRKGLLSVINQAGLISTLPYLQDLTERWVASGADQASPMWHEAHELAGHMLSTWPRETWRLEREGSQSAVTRFLHWLTVLQNTARIDTFAQDVIADGLFCKNDNEAILAALGILSPGRFTAIVEDIIDRSAVNLPGPCCNLMARAATELPVRSLNLNRAATSLLKALPRDPAQAAQREEWRRASRIESNVAFDLFTCLVIIDEMLAGRAADYVLAWPKIWAIDTILIPAVLDLTRANVITGSGAVERLRMACIDHLQTRIAEPLEAPRDWRRDSALGCKCPNCGQLSHFLDDRERKVWILKAAEPARSHVESTIRSARCDLDRKTETRGRPYSLICTKNQASYDRMVKQRNKDTKTLGLLDT